MNRKLIQKIIDELNKENPKLDYVRGILETVLESIPEDFPMQKLKILNIGSEKQPVHIAGEMSEAEIMDAKARAAIENIKRITAVSEETNVIKN